MHAVLAKEGIAVPMSDLFGKTGMALLAEAPLARAYRLRVSSLLDLIDAHGYEVALFTRLVAEQLHGHAGYRAIQALPGVGSTFAAIFVAEIGDVHRFPAPPKLCSWAGLTPRHRESDTTVHRGHSHLAKAPGWCAGPPSRRSRSCPWTSSCAPTATASRIGAARASARSPPPAGCSPSCTTVCATAHPLPGQGGGVTGSDAARRARSSQVMTPTTVAPSSF